MTPERWREVTQIYGAVLTRAPERRAAAVQELCGADSDLRREVESLLNSQHSVALLAHAATDYASVMGVVLPIGSMIGVFRIDALLCVGGPPRLARDGNCELRRGREHRCVRSTASIPDRTPWCSSWSRAYARGPLGSWLTA